MPKRSGPKVQAPFPSRAELLTFINEAETPVGKREIARAFHLDADQKKLLKIMLKELEADGALSKGRGRRFAEPGSLPEVTVIEVTHFDTDGETIARPVNWDAASDGAPPKIFMSPERKGHPALGPGDRVLARLKKVEKNEYEGRTIRTLPQAPSAVLGVVQKTNKAFLVKPIDKRAKNDFHLSAAHIGTAKPGDLVRIEVLPHKHYGLREAKVLETLDSTNGPKAISLIAIHESGIPVRFSDDAIKQAEQSKAPTLDHREDIRHIPLVTIDGEDARDFDDAVYAEPDTDPKNQGGYRLLVAIADVSWYVRPGTALDRDAYARGNSTYFPDRVVPMLPEALSNGWCSLLPKQDRGCLAAEMIIDKAGHLTAHRIFRGLMKSHARLTYGQVQAYHGGESSEATDGLGDQITALYGAYECLARHRKDRGVMELDVPERRVTFDETGAVADIVPRDRHDSHKLIEEFMIAANVAAAETLEVKRRPAMYRIHAEPPKDKIEVLREFLATLDIPLAKGQALKPRHFTTILEAAKETPHSHLVSQVVLRSQSQAQYSPDNNGHFGLALRRYCHFTSPIRRYADLLVHRALASGLGLGPGGLEADHKDFSEIGEHISRTERRSAAAERNAIDRFTAQFLAERTGDIFPGRITGVTRFGLFVTLDQSGADGLVPISSLPDDYYDHVEARHELVGRRSGLTFRMGDTVETWLIEADPITGSTVLNLAASKLKDTKKPTNSGNAYKNTSKSKKRTQIKGKSRAARRRKRISS